MKFNTQPILENENLILYPLQEADFDELYLVASDPKIWEQHPNKNRWQQDAFRVYFEGAIQSKGAYKIVEKATGHVAGSTRMYDYNESENSILIGYTFYATTYWGTGMNRAVKELMLDYLFQFVAQVGFHIGAANIRSQIAIGRLGAKKVAELEVAYFGEISKLNYVYTIQKDEWNSNRKLS